MYVKSVLMKKCLLTGLVAGMFLFTACGSVPLTGRKQVLLVSDQEVLASSLTQYKQYMQTAPRSGSVQESAMVTRVGKKIATATENYLRQNGLESEIDNFDWEFNLVKDDQVNAFCMPGGKIVVYEGMMKLISSDDELAVVLSHEVAHAVAKHSNERISQEMLAQYGAQVLSIGLSQKSDAVQAVAGQIYGLGAQYGVMLPFSRKHESEADYMGLALMTMAGYNPDVAVAFWQKMAASSTANIPEFLSTHPSDARRIQDITKELPEIKRRFAPAATGKKATQISGNGYHFSFE